MAAHDQRFKVLLQEFLIEFLLLFFADLVDQLDLENVEWLHQELYPDPPHGQLLTIDLIAAISLRQAPGSAGQAETILLHLEFEADDTVEPFRERFADYFDYLTKKFGRRVLPIAVYLRVGLAGQGKDAYVIRVLGRNVKRFEYDYVGLPRLPGATYLAGDNLLGVALSALMRWSRKKRARAAVQALERIVNSQESAYRKRLLCECVQAYAPLEDDQRIELNSLLSRPERTGVHEMIKTWTEEAEERGIMRGQLQGQRKLLLKQLQQRFPDLSQKAQQRLEQLSAEQLEELGLALMTAKSLHELGLVD